MNIMRAFRTRIVTGSALNEMTTACAINSFMTSLVDEFYSDRAMTLCGTDDCQFTESDVFSAEHPGSSYRKQGKPLSRLVEPEPATTSRRPDQQQELSMQLNLF